MYCVCLYCSRAKVEKEKKDIEFQQNQKKLQSLDEQVKKLTVHNKELSKERDELQIMLEATQAQVFI